MQITVLSRMHNSMVKKYFSHLVISLFSETVDLLDRFGWQMFKKVETILYVYTASSASYANSHFICLEFIFEFDA